MIAPAQATDLETQRPSGGASEARGRIGGASSPLFARSRSASQLPRAHSHTEAPQTAEEDPRYASPPPGYLPICGAKARAMGIVDNLMGSFVAMDALPAPHAEGSAACREDEDKCEDEGPWSIESEAVRYGQVMDMDAFLRWLPGSSDAGA
ncbi:hypothetical protein TRAPUB_12342 [Trametes pubescens]|uniref:Uncharacterized protein n=1 Tax=Trametes pubescens TaxID=154538 RepID=A0A1M2VU92_TRAPU|nr:hypothetical protein TRAPUB_12342 [Trametes pubescens]